MKHNNMNPIDILSRFQEEACRDVRAVDVEGIIRALGIELDMRASIENEISGQIEQLPSGNFRISANSKEAYTRQRFTIAHELGHYLLHRVLIGKGVDDNKVYRSTACGKFYNKNIGTTQETEANQFAANILMPWSLIDAMQKAGIIDPEQMAKKLQVSKKALCIRLGVPC